MSYDVYLSENWCEHCQRGDEVLSWNYTSNMSAAWREAGADIAEFHHKRAKDCAPLLGAAIDDMLARPEHYAPFNAPNGWGSMRTLVPALQRLLAAMEEHPDAVLRVSR